MNKTITPNPATAALDETHDPKLRAFVESANDPSTDFPIQNLALAVYRRARTGEAFRVGAAIGDRILDIHAVRALLDEPAQEAAQVCGQASMDGLMRLGRANWRALRLALSRLLREGSAHQGAASEHLMAMAEAEYMLPVAIPNFTDCSASAHHMSKAIRARRPDSPGLPAQFKWMPLAYNGRASTVRVSGYEFPRPKGQIGVMEEGQPVFGPTRWLDYEAELGIYIGTGSKDGESLSVDQSEDAIFGLSVLNDWTARDIQGWESQPLGPFQAKSFTTTISPWVVTMEALLPYRSAWGRTGEDPQPLPNLESAANREKGGIDVQVQVLIETPKSSAPALLGHSRLTDCYWTLAQLVAHHTANGCPLELGDLVGTGTISGPGLEQCGCIFELASAGRNPFKLPNGESRGFIEDGDTVTVKAFCEATGLRRIGFGSAMATVRPGR